MQDSDGGRSDQQSPAALRLSVRLWAAAAPTSEQQITPGCTEAFTAPLPTQAFNAAYVGRMDGAVDCQIPAQLQQVEENSGTVSRVVISSYKLLEAAPLSSVFTCTHCSAAFT